MTSQGADRFTARLPVCILQQVISIFVEDYKQRAKYILFWRSIEFVDNHMSHMRAVPWTQTRKTGNLIQSRTLKTNVSHPHFDSLAAFYSIILFYYILNTSRSTGSVPVLKHSCLTVLLSLWMDVGAVAFLWPSVQGKHSPPPRRTTIKDVLTGTAGLGRLHRSFTVVLFCSCPDSPKIMC